MLCVHPRVECFAVLSGVIECDIMITFQVLQIGSAVWNGHIQDNGLFKLHTELDIWYRSSWRGKTFILRLTIVTAHSTRLLRHGNLCCSLTVNYVTSTMLFFHSIIDLRTLRNILFSKFQTGQVNMQCLQVTG